MTIQECIYLPVCRVVFLLSVVLGGRGRLLDPSHPKSTPNHVFVSLLFFSFSSLYSFFFFVRKCIYIDFFIFFIQYLRCTCYALCYASVFCVKLSPFPHPTNTFYIRWQLVTRDFFFLFALSSQYFTTFYMYFNRRNTTVQLCCQKRS